MILLEGKFYFIQIVMSRVKIVQFQLFSITKKSGCGGEGQKASFSRIATLFNTDFSSKILTTNKSWLYID